MVYNIVKMKNKEARQIQKHTDIKQDQEHQRMNMLAARVPGIAFLIVNFIAVIIYQLFFEEWSILSLCILCLQMSLLAIYQWFAYKLVNFSNWLYFILQGIFIFSTTFIVDTDYDNYNMVTFTLYAYFIGQAIGLVSKKKIYIIGFLVLLFILNAILLIPKEEFKHFFIIIPIMILIISYAVMFFSQVYERINVQLTLEKLENAHAQVEQLTLQNERQRMARNLHDTLAQGLVGVNLQLDAAISHLSLSNTAKARDIITNARSNAKQLLAESRSVIDNLRDTDFENNDFEQRIQTTLDYFSATTDIDFKLEYHINSISNALTQEHCFYIIRESIINTIKHSKAKTVIVKLWETNQYYHFSIIDNGKGFDVTSALHKEGSYGLLGIKERVNLLYGNVSFHSDHAIGTKIVIDIPKDRGEKNVQSANS